MQSIYRPIPILGPGSADSALRLAGGWCHFTHIEVLTRGADPRIIAAGDAPTEVLDRLTTPRADFAGLSLDQPRLMGILNVTPDSFSDGGQFDGAGRAIARANAMVDAGADILDIGGESTRPGAAEVPREVEIARTAPVIRALREGGMITPISIDTRKADVAAEALNAGADIVNDVSALRFDPHLAKVAAEAGAPVILMHAQGTPETMQDNPTYDDVLLDIYQSLDASVARAEAAGIPHSRIVVDPGIGFGKTDAHNHAVLGRISLFHGLGCGVLLGVSRKGFIGRAAGIPRAEDRDAASAALGLWAVTQGIQLLRVHDIVIHKAGTALWQAIGALE